MSSSTPPGTNRDLSIPLRHASTGSFQAARIGLISPLSKGLEDGVSGGDGSGEQGNHASEIPVAAFGKYVPPSVANFVSIGIFCLKIEIVVIRGISYAHPGGRR